MCFDLIRNRPQFDLELLKPGVAIKYKFKKYEWEWINAIITKSEYDELSIVQYDDGDGGSCDGIIDLKQVLDKEVLIELLK